MTTSAQESLPVPQRRRRGPWTHRALVWMLSVVLALLTYWLIGFFLSDIGTWPGPDYNALEARQVGPQLRGQADSLDRKITEVQRQLENLRERQRLLRESISNSQRTVQQLLDLQRLSIEREQELNPQQREAMAENIRLFLQRQQQDQELTDQMLALQRELQQLQDDRQRLEVDIGRRRAEAQQQYRQQWEQHRLRLAAAKLGLLVPLILLAAVAFRKTGQSVYAPIVYALVLAVALQTLRVLHEYFPARYFKYVLIGVSLAVVLRLLIALLRMMVHPKADWLCKQYREAYEAFLCPICSYPIRTGPLRYLAWTRRSIRKLGRCGLPPAGPEEPYHCPACATALFEACSACGAVRHVLLPACQHCGAEQEIPVI